MRQTAPTVLLRNQAGDGWLSFKGPARICVARRLRDVAATLRAVEQAVETGGLYAAGFISYEAAPAFDPCLIVKPDKQFPLLWFGLFDKPAEPVMLPVCASSGLELLK